MASHSGGGDIVNCSLGIPTTKDLYHLPGLSTFGIVFVAISCVLIAVVIGLYVEQLICLYRCWRPSERLNTVIILLSLSPFIAFSSFLSVVVPRSGTLVDLLNQAFIAYCLEAFLRHIESYYGSVEQLCKALSDSTISLRGPPCCCCVCLPTLPVNSKTYSRIRALVIQTSYVRPLLMLIAAVLWTDNNYEPGVIAVDGAYIYLTALNTLSTIPAIYGLLRVFTLTKDHLTKEHIRAKFIHIQLTVLSTVIFNLICSILVKQDVIPCTVYLSSQGRGERIYHFILMVLMVPLCLMARFYYLPHHTGQPYVIQVEDVGPPPGIHHEHEEADDNPPTVADNNQISAGNVQDDTNTLQMQPPVV